MNLEQALDYLEEHATELEDKEQTIFAVAHDPHSTKIAFQIFCLTRQSDEDDAKYYSLYLQAGDLVQMGEINDEIAVGQKQDILSQVDKYPLELNFKVYDVNWIYILGLLPEYAFRELFPELPDSEIESEINPQLPEFREALIARIAKANQEEVEA